MSIIIGIDPGKHTGIAKWDVTGRQLLRVEEMLIHQAMNCIELENKAGSLLLVLVEDARQRTWFGNAGKEKLQGAGAAKRDACIWSDFLEDKKIPHVMVHPKYNNTKLTSDQFKLATGWQGRTNVHGRDAGMLCSNCNVKYMLAIAKCLQNSV